MLVELRVKNFKSFQDEQVFSMVASSDQDLPENIFDSKVMDDLKLLRVAVCYGANASGKSNLIKAIKFLKDFIKQIPDAHLQRQPFRLNQQTQQAPSEFEITFIHHGVRYIYGLSLDKERIHEEWLVAHPKQREQTWFERSFNPKSDKADNLGYEWEFGRYLKGDKEKFKKVIKPHEPFLSVAGAGLISNGTFPNPQLSELYRWFNQHLQIISANDDPSVLQELSQLTTFDYEPFYIFMKKFLQFADLGIVDFSVDKKRFLYSYDVLFRHQTSDNRGTVDFSKDNESDGTWRLFNLARILYVVFKTNAILLADELDDSLHPNIVKELVRLFYNPKMNLNNSQLIFNTHDSSLLKQPNLLRSDQIWYLEKNKFGASYIYSDFDYKANESREIGYLLGRYGAIPRLGNFEKGLRFDGSETKTITQGLQTTP